MIRINLIGVTHEPPKLRDTSAAGQKVTVACSLILAVTGLVIGWWYWSLRNQSVRLDQEVASAQQEVTRLQGVLQQVAQFEARRAQLQLRVNLIEQLRQSQSGPVHILDEISRGLPDRLWLTELTQEGDVITITGRATSLTALSDFIGNLEGSVYFKKPVEIINSQVETRPEGDLVAFSVKAQYAPPAV